MAPEMVVDVFRQTLWVSIAMMAVLILPGLAVGLVVAMFQAATQINEASLSFIPKIFITLFALMLAGPWLIKTIVSFSQSLFHNIPYLIG